MGRKIKVLLREKQVSNKMSKTVLVTGGAGYIGSWIVQLLLQAGHTVRVSVRNRDRTARYAHLEAIAQQTPGRLEIWEADLLQEGSFDEAVRGCSTVFHVASPFINSVKDPQKELVDPALQGTQNVLAAANRSGTVKKVVLTSSVAAIYGDAQDMSLQGLQAFTEAQWNHSSTLRHQSYSYSKLVAEKAAWEIAARQSDWQLVVINPSFVIGPVLSPESDSESLKLIRDLVRGKYFSGVPEMRFGFVDIRDVARAHVLADELPNAAGRYIVSSRTLTMMELTGLLKKVGIRSIGLPWLQSPKWLTVWLAPLFGLSRDFIKNNAGFPLAFDHGKSERELGLRYTPLEDSITEMLRSMHYLP